MIAEAFWQRRFGGAPDIIGRALVLVGQPFTITGIMPAGFQFPYRAGSQLQSATEHERTDLWMPFDPTVSARGRFGSVTGRLKGGVALAAAQSEWNVIAKRLEAQDPARNQGRGISMVPLSQEVVPAPVPAFGSAWPRLLHALI